MKTCTKLFTSTLGKKLVMAVSGLVLFLFVAGHLVGNLQIFLPPEAINRYGDFLQSNLELLWPVRIILLGMIGLHVWSAISLSLENKAARPDAYAIPPRFGSSLASRTMLVSGGIAGAFVVYHLLHFTVVVQAVSGTPVPLAALKDPVTGHHDVYAMVVAGFRVWYVSLFYLLGVGLLCFHLSHGFGAMFQSLGLRNPVYSPLLVKASQIIAVVLFLGYASIPAAVLLGHGQDYLQRVVNATAAGSGVANPASETLTRTDAGVDAHATKEAK